MVVEPQLVVDLRHPFAKAAVALRNGRQACPARLIHGRSFRDSPVPLHAAMAHCASDYRTRGVSRTFKQSYRLLLAY